MALLAGLAVGLWGTVLRPPAFEIRGTVVTRPAANLVVVKHDAVELLGMGAMELMGVVGDPAQLDAAQLVAGDRVRLAVKPRGDQLMLLRIEKLR